MIERFQPPFLTADIPGIGGVIKREPDDFDVEEVPAYEPCGQGEHLYLWIEKRNLGAEFFLRQAAARLDIAPQDIGTAGNKDRHAVTRQWISVPAVAEDRIAQLDGDGIRVLKVARHTNKLRHGHLRGNRFRILIREAARNPDTVTAMVDGISALGLPNFYGEQRFGRAGSTLETGLALLRGERLPCRPSFFLRKLALSAVQSWLFNSYLAARMTDRLLRTVLAGDVLAKWPAGGMFVSEQPEVDQPRLDAREVVPAGPMFGTKMFPARSRAADRESPTLQAAGLSLDSFAAFGKLLQGTRRHNLVYVDDLAAEWEEHGLRLIFTLPAGSYATVLLRELTKASANDEELRDVD